MCCRLSYQLTEGAVIEMNDCTTSVRSTVFYLLLIFMPNGIITLWQWEKSQKEKTLETQEKHSRKVRRFKSQRVCNTKTSIM